LTTEISDDNKAEGLRTQTTVLDTNVLTTLIVNGEPQQIRAQTVAEALRALDYADVIVATALNGEFVPARKREATPVRDGDRIEIVAPRQGG
jgi:sulfur carrier protein